MRVIHNKQVFERNVKQRNFGFGKQPSFAAALVLRAAFGNGNYQTRHTHQQRFKNFIAFCHDTHSVTDMREVTASVISHYVNTLSIGVEHGQYKISYAQNLLSTVNVVMECFRGDKKLFLSPSKTLGRRSYIRTRDPRCTFLQLKAVIAEAKPLGLERVAAVAALAFAFAMRYREAVLADLERLKLEALTGKVTILEGCKGGRRSEDRQIDIDEEQRFALTYALSVKPFHSKNLLAPDERYIDFRQRDARKLRPILKRHGIRHFHELRAARLVLIYEQESGSLPPFLGGAPSKKADKLGRQKTSIAAGHGSQRPGVSYVGGKRYD